MFFYINHTLHIYYLKIFIRRILLHLAIIPIVSCHYILPPHQRCIRYKFPFCYTIPSQSNSILVNTLLRYAQFWYFLFTHLKLISSSRLLPAISIEESISSFHYLKWKEVMVYTRIVEVFKVIIICITTKKRKMTTK